ncbi:MAG: multicomponent antiporter subunit [Pseudomonadota bacterium]
MNHLIILPIVLPLFVAAISLLPLFDREIARQRSLALAASVALLLISAILLGQAATGEVTLYALGDWQAPYGIQLLGDRLSTLMLLTTSTLLLAALLYGSAGEDKKGRFYYPLMMFQVMGINGAFLTADIFNLFVFFEILLIASYSLLIHGGGKHKTGAAVHYVLLNLVGSAIFLFALGIIYGTLGTLNIPDLAIAVRNLNPEGALLAEVGGLMLFAVFGLKAAILPLQFWLPKTYSSAPASVVALFAIMTKVGIYSIIRVHDLVFGANAGLLANLGIDWMWALSLLTLAIATLGVISSPSVKRLASHLVILSVGTLMVAISINTQASTAAALYYAVHSTFAAAALFLIGDLISLERERSLDRIVPGRRLASAVPIGILFVISAITLIGMPPLSGFIGKLMVMQSITNASEIAFAWPLLLIGSLAALIAFSRSGSTLFWKATGDPVDQSPIVARQFTAVWMLVLAALFMSVFAGPITEYTTATAAQLADFEANPSQLMRAGE